MKNGHTIGENVFLKNPESVCLRIVAMRRLAFGKMPVRIVAGLFALWNVVGGAWIAEQDNVELSMESAR